MATYPAIFWNDSDGVIDSIFRYVRHFVLSRIHWRASWYVEHHRSSWLESPSNREDISNRGFFGIRFKYAQILDLSHLRLAYAIYNCFNNQNSSKSSFIHYGGAKKLISITQSCGLTDYSGVWMDIRRINSTWGTWNPYWRSFSNHLELWYFTTGTTINRQTFCDDVCVKEQDEWEWGYLAHWGWRCPDKKKLYHHLWFTLFSSTYATCVFSALY